MTSLANLRRTFVQPEFAFPQRRRVVAVNLHFP